MENDHETLQEII